MSRNRGTSRNNSNNLGAISLADANNSAGLGIWSLEFLLDGWSLELMPRAIPADLRLTTDNFSFIRLFYHRGAFL